MDTGLLSMLSTLSLPQVALGVGAVATAGTVLWAGSAKLKEHRDEQAAAQAALAEANAIANADVARIAAEEAARAQLAREEEERRLAEEAELQHQEELEYIRQNPRDHITKIIGEANTKLAEIERTATIYDRGTATAQADVDEALAEFPNGVMPSAKDMKTIVLKFVLWLVVAVISMLLLFQLAMGITHSFVISAIIAPVFVALLEGCSVWLNGLFERHQAKLITEARFRISVGLTVAVLLVFGVFTYSLSSMRAENANAAEKLRLQNTIATLEADAATAPLNDEDALVLAVDKDKLVNLQSGIEQETTLYAVAECLALPAELWLGMVLPVFSSIRKARNKYEMAMASMKANTESAEQERGTIDVLNAQTWERLRGTMWEARVPFEAIGLDAEPGQLPAGANNAHATNLNNPRTPDPDDTILLSTIRYTATAGGSVQPESESVESLLGIVTGSVAAPSPGYEFVGWTDELGNTVTEDPGFMPSKAENEAWEDGVTFLATFAESPDVTIFYEATAGGSVSEASERLALATGISQGCTAEPDQGYVFESWVDAQGTPVGDNPAFIPEKADDEIWADGRVYTAIFRMSAVRSNGFDL
ncbi:MAG: hypothetical protein LBI64_01400 [Coriobacteriales bacterium]|jgi:hypothetical protein|nr:hypothetical protein [Coriobacteriales bacterium]